MSQIVCSKCDYVGGSSVYNGNFRYATPYGTISLKRRLGWCMECDSLVPVEHASPEVREEGLEEDLESCKGKCISIFEDLCIYAVQQSGKKDEVAAKVKLILRNPEYEFLPRLLTWRFSMEYLDQLSKISEDEKLEDKKNVESLAELIHISLKMFLDKNPNFLGNLLDSGSMLKFLDDLVVPKMLLFIYLFAKPIEKTNLEIFKPEIINRLKHVIWLHKEVRGPSELKDYLNCTRMPRCLSCGSYDIIKEIKIPYSELEKFSNDYKTTFPTGHKHPKCGGDLLAKNGGFTSCGPFKPRIYSLEGERLKGPDYEEDFWSFLNGYG